MSSSSYNSHNQYVDYSALFGEICKHPEKNKNENVGKVLKTPASDRVERDGRNLCLIRWCIGSQRCAYRRGETWSSFDNQKTTWADFVLDILKFWREGFSSVEDGISEFGKAQLGYTPSCMVSEGRTPEEAGFQAMTEAANTKAFLLHQQRDWIDSFGSRWAVLHVFGKCCLNLF